MDARKQEPSSVGRAFLFTLNVAGWLWSAVSFVPWYYLSGNYKKMKPGQKQAELTSSGTYRCVENVNRLVTDYDGVRTMNEVFAKACSRHSQNRCLGTRELLAEEEEMQANGRMFKKVILGEYKWLTYSQVADRLKRMGSGLSAIGMKPRQNIIIFAETKADWIIAAQACFAYNFPVVTIYATLGDDALIYGINESEANVIITDSHLVPKLKALFDQLHFINTIVYFGEAKKASLVGFSKDVSFYSSKEIDEIGGKPQNLSVSPESPSEDDLAVIMYTSGSTGMPKGVLITHLNIVSAVGALSSRVPGLSESDVYIGYLPLAHVLELCAETAVLGKGCSIGYSSALTLSDQSSKIKKGSKGDVSVLRPTLMAAVPMIMDRIRKNVLDKVREGPGFLRLLFQFAYNYKLVHLKQGFDTPLLNRLFFSKIAGILGGRVRAILSGGAPLSSDTEDFMNVCFSCPVGQGYGLTETCGGGTCCQAWDFTTGRVGPPIASNEIKLVSWEEGNYTVYDKPNPRGEIAICGSNVTRGYYKQPEKTNEVFVVENGKRWFYTGDIGEMHPDGCLQIVDRKKDLVKLCTGEYVSLGKIEGALKQSPYIDNCCVYVHGEQMFPIVLVIPNPKHLKTLCATVGLHTDSLEEMAVDKRVNKALIAAIESVAKTAKLEKYEIPRRAKICTEQWTPESELVTAAFKLKRKNLTDFYKADLRAMYVE
eukprot:gene11017-12181_t